jgi:hypothetical protein
VAGYSPLSRLFELEGLATVIEVNRGRGECAPEAADFAAHIDQQFDVFVGSLPAHRVDVEVL